MVEDDDATRLMMSNALLAVGYGVKEAGSAESALAISAYGKPVLVILDLELPGPAASTSFVSPPRSWWTCRCCIVTSHVNTNMTNLPVGTYELMPKPTDFVDLLKAVDRLTTPKVTEVHP